MDKNIISKQLLSSIRNENVNESNRSYTVALSSRKRSKYYNEVSIFLSHKHGETELIKQVITLLKKLGVSVYVDWLDSAMPKYTNGSTATRIKKKIRECQKFILLATEEAIKSKWCNWELGYGDSQKYFENIAVMPITDSPKQSFSGNEYLQIYPIITSEYYYATTGSFYVEFQGKRIKLEQWLKS